MMLKTPSAVKQLVFQRRGFFSSVIRLNSAAVPSLPYLHAHPSQTKFAISYVSTEDLKKPDLDPELIIGWSTDKENLSTKTFVENTKFVTFLTKVLAENIHKVDDTNLKAMADWQKEGWLHVNDERNPPPWGRIGFPEDIIGSVEVKDGIIQEGTYQAMPAHRLMTRDGIFKLSDPLTKLVVNEAKKKASSV